MKRIIVSIFSLLLTFPIFACTNLIITKGASKDGSVMVTYAADSHTRYGTLVHYPANFYRAGEMLKIYEWGKDRFLGEIPQAQRTYNVIGNINEHQVLIGESTWGGREEFRDPDGILDYGSAMYIALQRSKTAREAIDIFTSIIEEYGYASSGESISFADANEAWFLEIIGKKPKYSQEKDANGKAINLNKGAVWVAIRIPDGYISAHANCARITTFPLNDSENCHYSKDVISHARELGLFDGKDEEFSFADTYGPLDFSGMRGCEARVWSFFRKYGAEDMDQYLDYASGENPNNRMPLYVKAKEKLSVKEVADMMRDHYERTPFDMTTDIGAGPNELPYRWRPMNIEIDGVTIANERAIATQQTGFWFVGQCRSWLPDEIGALIWFAVDDAATSPLTPVYASSTEVSPHYALGNGSMIEYSESSMFWLQNRIAQFAYLRYNQIGKEVRIVIDEYENEIMENITKIDNKALEIYKGGKKAKKATQFLTDFSIEHASKLFQKWSDLDKYLLVKYIDGNTKKQDPQTGKFITNGHSETIPPTPIWEGYSDKFKRAIKDDPANKIRIIK